MGPTSRRLKLDRHGAELLALRRAGATVARLTRWLRIERNTVVAATTVGRWLENARARGIRGVDVAGDFDAVAALDALRLRDRELRFPRLAVSCIDEYGYHLLRQPLVVEPPRNEWSARPQASRCAASARGRIGHTSRADNGALSRGARGGIPRMRIDGRLWARPSGGRRNAPRGVAAA